MYDFHVDPDITKAETLPASFYRSDDVFEALKDLVFKPSFQWFGSVSELLPIENFVKPLSFIDGFIEEPFFSKKQVKKFLVFQMFAPTVETSFFIMKGHQSVFLVAIMEGSGKKTAL